MWAAPQALSTLGPIVESTSGRTRYTTVYALSAIAGSLFSYWFSPTASVGASGAAPPARPPRHGCVKVLGSLVPRYTAQKFSHIWFTTFHIC